MTTLGGVLVFWNAVAPGHEAEFTAWYQRQHVPERLAVPGFVDARRYRAADGSARFCAIYRLADVAVLASARYRERLAHPTRWTARVMPALHDTGRATCRVTRVHGSGVGACFAMIAAVPPADAAPGVRERIAVAFERAASDPRVTRLELWENETEVSSLPNPEQALRPGGDRVPEWLASVETIDHASLVSACDALVGQIAAAGARVADPQPRRFDLIWLARAGECPPPVADPAHLTA